LLKVLYLGIGNLIYTQLINMSAYYVPSLCTKYCFKFRNYKILARAETLRLCMTDKFNKNEINIDIQFFKLEKQTRIIVIAFYNLYIYSREQ
jgi:hypothetical protein